nr:hypothetical protein [Prevotella sp.]
MKFYDGFNVGYNVQTAIEADSHLIATYNVSTNLLIMEKLQKL